MDIASQDSSLRWPWRKCMSKATELALLLAHGHRHDLGLNEIAECVGYSSASTFSTAFSRYVGQAPSRYARERP